MSKARPTLVLSAGANLRARHPTGAFRLRQRSFLMRSYAICTTPRTGSTYLCKRLRSNGLGNPDEWLYQGRARSWKSIDALRRQKKLNDIFAVKLFWAHREDGMIVDFDDMLPKGEDAWIYLRRRDVRSQALSYLTAIVRQEWAEVGVPYLEFSEVEVDRMEARLRRRNQDWVRWFRWKGIRPLRITYEGFISQPDQTIAEIREFLMATWPSG